MKISLSSVLTFFLLANFLLLTSVFAQGTGDATVNIRVLTPVPQFSLTNAGGVLEVRWNWDNVSLGYVPPAVTQMLVQISDNAINYNTPQNHPPGDFLASYPGLPPADYTAQVTVMDGNDYDYIVGPVTIAASGGGGPPRRDATDVTINGLAYPGPSTVVIFTYNSAFQSNVLTDSNGNFTFNTNALPVGDGVLSFTARDPNNVLSSTLSMNTTIPASDPFTVSSVDLPPTIEISADTALAGETIILNGYGYKNGSISVTIDGPTSLAMLVQAGADGSWQANFNTTPLVTGTYTVSAIAGGVGGVTSPESEELQLQITSPFPTAPVCGDGVVDAPEQCDDGDFINGDGCSDACQIETDLPQSRLTQPAPIVQVSNDIDLYYSASSPNGTISSVRVFYSRNGAPYVQYSGSFSGSPAALVDLADGDYEVYSIATDSIGAVELPPSTADASFVIDAVVELNVLGYPEKRSPRQGNWAMAGVLDLYDPVTKRVLYHFDVNADNQGRVDVPAGSLPEQNYTFLLKGASQLSKRLESPAFRGIDLLLDFTFGGTFFLLGGDVFADDYINGMDISRTIVRLYSGFLNADQNLDGLVNGMDLSIVVTNLYKSGDGV